MASDQTNDSQAEWMSDDVTTLCWRIVTGNQAAHPRKLIQQISERSKVRYKEVKRQKQNEIADRVDAGRTPGDKKKLKKKVDNNASSVASRARREYFCEQLQELLEEKIALTNELAKAFLQKQDQLLRAQNEINSLRSQQLFENQGISIHQNTPTVQQSEPHPAYNMIDDLTEPLPQYPVERFDVRGVHQSLTYNALQTKQDPNQSDITVVGNLLEYGGLSPQEILPAKEKFERAYDYYDIARQETLKNELRPEDHAPSNPVA